LKDISVVCVYFDTTLTIEGEEVGVPS